MNITIVSEKMKVFVVTPLLLIHLSNEFYLKCIYKKAYNKTLNTEFATRRMNSSGESIGSK